MKRRFFNNKVITLVFLISLIVLVQGCSKDGQTSLASPYPEERFQLKKLLDEEFKAGDKLIPLQLDPEESFDEVNGWLSDNEVIFTTYSFNSYQVVSYNLFTGQRDILFISKEPIVQLEIDPSREAILIHKSLGTYLANITIVDLEGKELFSQEFESAELYFNWNQFIEGELIISAFHSDWTFDVFKINYTDQADKALAKTTVESPFPQWVDENTVAFLENKEDQPSLTAPLIFKNLKDSVQKKIHNNLIEFRTFDEYLMTVEVEDKNATRAAYNFYKADELVDLEIDLPLLTTFSSWLVPYYSLFEEEDIFYMLRPYSSGAADLYSDKFALISHDLNNLESELILDKLDNEPLTVSPDGSKILYGYQQEKLICLATKEVIDLVDFS